MNAETEDAPEKSMQVSVGDKTVEGTEEGAESMYSLSSIFSTSNFILMCKAYMYSSVNTLYDSSSSSGGGGGIFLCFFFLVGEIKSAKVETKATVLEAEAYRSVVSYKAESVGQISFDTGETLYVLHKLQDGKQLFKITNTDLLIQQVTNNT